MATSEEYPDYVLGRLLELHEMSYRNNLKSLRR